MAKETFAKQIVFSVGGIDGDAFDDAVGRLDQLDVTWGGDNVLLRKRPGRASYHQIQVWTDERIPTPERETAVRIDLFTNGTRVATGVDHVAPAGKPGEDKEVCDPGCITK